MPAVGADKVCQQVSVSCLFIKVCWAIFTPLSLKPNDLHMHKQAQTTASTNILIVFTLCTAADTFLSCPLRARYLRFGGRSPNDSEKRFKNQDPILLWLAMSERWMRISFCNRLATCLEGRTGKP